MVIGKIHAGSGLGDQLFSYIITRVIALDKGYDFGFVGKEFFKGKDFMNLDWGEDIDSLVTYRIEQPSGKLVIQNITDANKYYHLDTYLFPEFVFDKPYFDPESQFITDNTIIDGYGAQDERYWGHRLKEINEWLKVEKRQIEDKTIIINYRGGEYKTVPDLYLTKEYWWDSASKMMEIYKTHSLETEVHTDDPEEAEKMLPGNLYNGFKDLKKNWQSVRYARKAIISNSAFAIIPRLLKHLEDPEAITIAPFGWNARNASLTEWKGRPQNYYKKFTYI